MDVRAWMVLVSMGAMPLAGVAAQAPVEGPTGLAEARAGAIETLGEKFSSLAREVPEELQDWRPMEGVRSFREVFSLIAAEWAFFPVAWGPDGEDARRSFQETVTRMEALTWTDLVEALETGARRTAEAVRVLEDAPGDRMVSLGRRKVTARVALALLQYDMHEHLGQAIAYARINHIVPPWSRGTR
ncbi:MAG: DinB family protein [Gemmatimonadota bacterium]|jgi:hypothetical protein